MRLTRVARALAIALAVSLLPQVVAAQQATSDSSRRVLVRRLMEVTHVRELTERNGEQMIRTQMAQMPVLRPYEGVLRDFYREEMDWKVLEPEYTKLYLDVFSESELQQLIDLYQSPTGQMMLAKMPLLMTKTNELVMRRMQDAMPRLLAKLQAASGGGTTGPSSGPGPGPR